MRILLEAPILTKSGYGEHARLVYKALKRHPGAEIMVNPLNWGATTWEQPEGEILRDIQSFGTYMNQCEGSKQQPEYSMQIHVGIPSEFEKRAPYSVCITAGIETDRVDPGWLIKTHQGIDKIIVPSEHARAGFVNTRYEVINQQNNTNTEIGCACPVDVIAYPAKSPEGKALNIDFDTDFNFLTIAMMGARKNLETTIGGFIKEFRDQEDAGLIVKTSAGRSSVMDRRRTKTQLEALIASHGEKKCKVYLLHGDLSESEIHSLYTHPKVKAYVTTTHGEGYGLPVFEAAYSGLPIVATDWSGHLDFLTGDLKGKSKKLFARVEYEVKQVQQHAVWSNIITAESKWAYAKEGSYRAQIRKVYSNHGMYKSWAKSLQATVLENHKLENILDQYRISILSSKENPKPKKIEGISFCISTNASKVEKTNLEIKSIKRAMKKVKVPCEIIVAGVTEPFKEIEGVTFVGTPEDANSGLLAKLRNNAAEKSRYDTIVFVDDDFVFPENWIERLLQFSESTGWEVLGNKILLPDGGRFWDRCTMKPHSLVPYDHPDLFSNIYQTGGFWIMRRETYLKNKWNSDIPINGAERGISQFNEDIDLSTRIHSAGIKFVFDRENLVWHNDDSYTEFENLTLKKDILISKGMEDFAPASQDFKDILTSLQSE